MSFYRSEATSLLIDVGLSGKRVEQSLERIGERIQDVQDLVTHEHRDHIHGVGILSRRFDIPIYANAHTWAAMENYIGDVREKI